MVRVSINMPICTNQFAATFPGHLSPKSFTQCTRTNLISLSILGLGHQFLSLTVNNSFIVCILYVRICFLIVYVIYRLHPLTMKFDDILVKVGEFGFYQKRLYLILCIPAINVGCYMMMLVYTMHTPDHR